MNVYVCENVLTLSTAGTTTECGRKCMGLCGRAIRSGTGARWGGQSWPGLAVCNLNRAPGERMTGRGVKKGGEWETQRVTTSHLGQSHNPLCVLGKADA